MIITLLWIYLSVGAFCALSFDPGVALIDNAIRSGMLPAHQRNRAIIGMILAAIILWLPIFIWLVAEDIGKKR